METKIQLNPNIKINLDELMLDNDFKFSNEKKPNSTELRVSTMTGVCNLNCEIDLKILYTYLDLNLHKGIKYVEFGNFPTKGIKSKQISEKKAKKKKVFFNQITIVVKLGENESNIKLFNNGSISMTGLKSEQIGRESVTYLIPLIKKATQVIDDETVNALNSNKCELEDFKIVLINSDFYAGFEIKRSELHHLLLNKYKIFSSYEPCIYPGVNSKFYWNSLYRDKPHIGKCHCTKMCEGKGNGNGDGQCKKITIATFQSGSVIITGARNIDQVHDAYKFINRVFDENYEMLKKQNAPFLDLEDTLDTIKNKPEDNEIIYIKKSNIKLKIN